MNIKNYHVRPYKFNTLILTLGREEWQSQNEMSNPEARELALAILALTNPPKPNPMIKASRCSLDHIHLELPGAPLVILFNSEAKALVEAISPLLAEQNPVKPKETPKEGPSDWVEQATKEIHQLQDEYFIADPNTQPAFYDIARIIRKHACAHLETIKRDEELKKLNEENHELERRAEDLKKEVKNLRSGIIIANQRFSHLKAALRNLASEPYNYQQPA